MTLSRSKITENVQRIQEDIPPGVTLVAAVKGRTPAEVEAAAQAGVAHFGHNYVQEAEKMIRALPGIGKWHMIGHLQRNKAARAIEIFDLIETVDSLRIAEALNRRAELAGRVVPVLVEINSAREQSKAGVLPESAVGLIEQIDRCANLRVEGLMTMGPTFGNPEDSRPAFQATRKLLEQTKSAPQLKQVELNLLSMGMSDSYRIAIEEGATIVRIGTLIFGPRSTR